MKKIAAVFILVGFFFLLTDEFVTFAASPPSRDRMLPEVSLPTPESLDEKSYLGISGYGHFKIPQIKAQVIVIEIFSMYCPYCQKDAPGVNEVYRRIENNPNLKDKIKMIGIGAGNSLYEVEVFKRTNQVPFPLFSDKDFAIHKAYGEVRTPYYIVVRINNDGTHQIVHAQLGGFHGAESFLQLVLRVSGL